MTLNYYYYYYYYYYYHHHHHHHHPEINNAFQRTLDEHTWLL
jgi:hypothetical protein